MNEYLSIRSFSKSHRVLSERQLRQMIAEGKVPGIQTTNPDMIYPVWNFHFSAFPVILLSKETTF